MGEPSLSMDTESPDAIPYFNWDVPITNAEVRATLREGTDAERIQWIARIMREARYPDVWKYVSLRRDILPAWDRLSTMLGRNRPFWVFLIEQWRRAGIIQ